MLVNGSFSPTKNDVQLNLISLVRAYLKLIFSMKLSVKKDLL